MPLSSIVGHANLTTLLQTAVSRDSVPQSLLFAGPEGVGKRTVAIALAQAVNCPKGGCGTCPTCERIARGQHTDVTLIDKGDEASIKIKTIRERVLDVIGYRPFEARRRVFIIDPADELTIEAQDALLKTLEEPPTSAMIILVSAYPDTLLATIQSRCRRLRFGFLSDKEVTRVLAERAGVDPMRARLLAAEAGGSVSRALSEEAADVEDDRDAAMGLLQAAAGRALVPKLKAAAALASNESKRRDREALGARLSLVAALCRDLTALHAGASAALANADLADTLGELSRAFPSDRLVRAFDAIDRAHHALERNASPKIVADWLGATI